MSDLIKGVMILPWAALGCLFIGWAAPHGLDPNIIGFAGAPFLAGYLITTGYLCEVVMGVE